MKRAYSWQALMRSPWFASAAAKRRCAARSKGAISTAIPRSAIAFTRSFLRANAAVPSRRPRAQGRARSRLLLAAASGFVGEGVEAQRVEHAVECGRDLVRDVVAA